MRRFAAIALLTLGCRGESDNAARAAAVGEGGKAVVAVEASNIKDDELVVFLPTFGTRTGDVWRMPVEVWVFEPEADAVVRTAALAAIGSVIDLTDDPAEEARLLENMRPFLVDNEGGKHVRARWGDRGGELCETESNGRCSAALELAVGSAPASSVVEISTVLPKGDARVFTGRVHLMPDAGISIVSDIDDTIKVTEVHDKAKLIRNTFLLPPQAAPGVAALYQRWAEQGAGFHYLSNSPLPLVGALTRFIDSAGFPAGSLALKPFRWKDGTFLELLAAPEDHKSEALAAIVERFQMRRFILVGDTGERDPEIYAAAARRFGDRVVKIYLRDPQAGTPELDARLGAAFEGLPRELWTVFVDGSEIKDDLPAK